jgi:hypothetical protein
MIVNVAATSLSGPRTENIDGTGTLHFAGNDYDVEFDGSFSTNMNPTTQQLEVIESPFTIALSEPVTFSRSLPVLTIVPGLAALYGVPVLGDLAEALSLATLNLTVTANLDGNGTIGVTSNDELGITSGLVSYQLGGTGSVVVGVPSVAWLQVSGNITGNVGMALAPQPAISDCSLITGFTLAGGIVGGYTFSLPEFTQVPLCD